MDDEAQAAGFSLEMIPDPQVRGRILYGGRVIAGDQPYNQEDTERIRNLCKLPPPAEAPPPPPPDPAVEYEGYEARKKQEDFKENCQGMIEEIEQMPEGERDQYNEVHGKFNELYDKVRAERQSKQLDEQIADAKQRSQDRTLNPTQRGEADQEHFDLLEERSRRRRQAR
jgi:hypothetical protein